jgi:ADP-ribose pyrophosphatase YjhB (NUDIX family)
LGHPADACHGSPQASTFGACKKAMSTQVSLPMNEPQWLTIARELQAIAQTGLAYTKDKFDAERFRQIRAIAAGIMAAGSATAVEQVIRLFAKDEGYATPKVDVRGAVFRDGLILLVREISDGRWTLPGGWADVNQSAAECVEREVAEESGFQVRAGKLAAVWDYRRQGDVPPHPFSIYKMFFCCEIVAGRARSGVETSEVAFFAEDSLPDLSVGRVTAAQIRRMFEHARQPGLATDFD